MVTKPNISKLKVFGSVGYCLVPKDLRTKLDSKTTKNIMVGYSPNGYRLWNSDKAKVVIARDVIFDECFNKLDLSEETSADVIADSSKQMCDSRKDELNNVDKVEDQLIFDEPIGDSTESINSTSVGSPRKSGRLTKNTTKV